MSFSQVRGQIVWLHEHPALGAVAVRLRHRPDDILCDLNPSPPNVREKYGVAFHGAVIRSAGVGDLEALYELEVVCFAERRFTRDHLLYILRHPRASTFVYEDGRVLGSIMLHDEGGVLRVLSVGVHPSCRRRGVGGRLMTLAEDMAVKFHSSEVRLEVSTRNEGAIAFYSALGYETTGTIPRYYSWGEDAHSMRKAVAIEVQKS